MPRIDLSTPTYRRLLRRVTSFDDRPEEVIQRLLDEVEDGDVEQVGAIEVDQRSSARAAPGSILPEREYWRPILAILAEADGSAPANDVIDALGNRMRNVLTPNDFAVLKMGEVRWRNRARFARLRMREQGLLSSDSHRGVWEMTDMGREYLAQEDKATSDDGASKKA
jgi:hypothetical protein